MQHILQVDLHQEESHIHIGLDINPTDARWLALLIDTEGAIGWTRRVLKRDRIDERYRHTYKYASPYFSVGMKAKESKTTMEDAGRLVRRTPSEAVYKGESYLYVAAEARRALVVLDAVKPYLDKFSRMARLLSTLFRYHTYIPPHRFLKAVENIFGKTVTPKEANEIMLTMTEEEFTNLIEVAEKQTNLRLR